MGLFVIGLNHKECPVEVHERLPLRFCLRRGCASAANEAAVGIKPFAKI